MATDRKPDALSTLRARLEAHGRDPRAAMFGLAQTVQALNAAMLEQAQRQADIAAAVCALERAVNRISPSGSPPIFTDDTRGRLLSVLQAVS